MRTVRISVGKEENTENIISGVFAYFIMKSTSYIIEVGLVLIASHENIKFSFLISPAIKILLTHKIHLNHLAY